MYKSKLNIDNNTEVKPVSNTSFTNTDNNYTDQASPARSHIDGRTTSPPSYNDNTGRESVDTFTNDLYPQEGAGVCLDSSVLLEDSEGIILYQRLCSYLDAKINNYKSDSKKENFPQTDINTCDIQGCIFGVKAQNEKEVDMTIDAAELITGNDDAESVFSKIGSDKRTTLASYDADYLIQESIAIPLINFTSSNVLINNSSLVRVAVSDLSIEGHLYNNVPSLGPTLFYGSVKVFVSNPSDVGVFKLIDECHVGNTFDGPYTLAVSDDSVTAHGNISKFKFKITSLFLEPGDQLTFRCILSNSIATSPDYCFVDCSYHKFNAHVDQVQPLNLSFLSPSVYKSFNYSFKPEILTTLLYCDNNSLLNLDIKFCSEEGIDMYIARIGSGVYTYDSIIASGGYVKFDSKRGIKVRLVPVNYQNSIVIFTNARSSLQQIRLKLVSSGDVELNPGPNCKELLDFYVMDDQGKITLVDFGTRYNWVDYEILDDDAIENVAERITEDLADMGLTEVISNDNVKKDNVLAGPENKLKAVSSKRTYNNKSRTNVNKIKPDDKPNVANITKILNKEVNKMNSVDIINKASTTMSNPNHKPSNELDRQEIIISKLGNRIFNLFSSLETHCHESVLLIWCTLSNHSNRHKFNACCRALTLAYKQVNPDRNDDLVVNGPFIAYLEDFIYNVLPSLKQELKKYKVSISDDISFQTSGSIKQDSMSNHFDHERTLIMWLMIFFSEAVGNMRITYENGPADDAFIDKTCKHIKSFDFSEMVATNGDGYGAYISKTINAMMHALNGNIDAESIPSSYDSSLNTTYNRLTIDSMLPFVNRLFSLDTFQVTNPALVTGLTGLIKKSVVNNGIVAQQAAGFCPYSNLFSIYNKFKSFNGVNVDANIAKNNIPCVSWSLDNVADIKVGLTQASSMVLQQIREGNTNFGRSNLISRSGYRVVDYTNLCNIAEASLGADHSNVSFCFNSMLLFDSIMWLDKSRADGSNIIPNSVMYSINTHAGLITAPPLVRPAGIGGVAPYIYTDVNDHIQPQGTASSLTFSNGLLNQGIWPLAQIVPRNVIIPQWIINSGGLANTFLSMYLACLTSQPWAPIIIDQTQEFYRIDTATGLPVAVPVIDNNLFRTAASTMLIPGMDDINVVIPMNNIDQNDRYVNAFAAAQTIAFRPQMGSNPIGGFLANAGITLTYKDANNDVIIPGAYLTIGDYIYSWFNTFTLKLWQTFMTNMAMLFGMTSEMELAFDMYCAECFRCRPAVHNNYDTALHTPTYNGYVDCFFNVNSNINLLHYPASIVNASYNNNIKIQIAGNRRFLNSFNIDIYNGICSDTLYVPRASNYSFRLGNVSSPGSVAIARAVMLNFASAQELERDGYSVASLNNMYAAADSAVFAGISGYMNTPDLEEGDVSDLYNGIMNDLFGLGLASYKGITCFSYPVLVRSINTWDSAFFVGGFSPQGYRIPVVSTWLSSAVSIPDGLLRLLLDKEMDNCFSFKNNGVIGSSGIIMANGGMINNGLVVAGAQIVPTNNLFQHDYTKPPRYENFEYYNNKIIFNLNTFSLTIANQIVLGFYTKTAITATSVFSTNVLLLRSCFTPYANSTLLPGVSDLITLFGFNLWNVYKTTHQNFSVKLGMSGAALATWISYFNAPGPLPIAQSVKSNVLAVNQNNFISRYTSNKKGKSVNIVIEEATAESTNASALATSLKD